MRALWLLTLYSAPRACRGLRRTPPLVEVGLPANPPNASSDLLRVKPVGRHIQYLGNRKGSGISDRISVLQWLVDLGTFNNATVHLKGGPLGAASYLDTRHSKHVSSNWSHYFDIEAGCGAYPFNDAEPFEGCVNISDPHFNFADQLFSNESGCVNLMLRRYDYLNSSFNFGDRKRRCDIWKRGLAPIIYERSRKLVEERGLARHFGAYHIRRCDKFRANAVCTDASVVASVINNITGVKDWMIFYYAEKVYRDRLLQELSCPSCNRTIIFEDDLELNPYEDGDNYVTWLVAEDILRNRASVSVDSNRCAQGVGTIKGRRELSGMFASGHDDDQGAAEEEGLFGRCWSRWEMRHS